MIQIINTGVANIRSLQAAFDRIGEAWSLTEDAEAIASASHVVLPGVGAFGAAAAALDSSNFAARSPIAYSNPIKQRSASVWGCSFVAAKARKAPASLG